MREKKKTQFGRKQHLNANQTTKVRLQCPEFWENKDKRQSKEDRIIKKVMKQMQTITKKQKKKQQMLGGNTPK